MLARTGQDRGEPWPPFPSRSLRCGRGQIFMTLALLLAAWLGVVHAVTASLVFLIRQDAHSIDRLKAVVDASAGTTHTQHVIMLSLLVPGLVLWMALDWMRPRQPKRSGPKPALWLRVTFHGAEYALMLWVMVVSVTAAFFVYVLGQDAGMLGQLGAAFAAGNNGR